MKYFRIYLSVSFFALSILEAGCKKPIHKIHAISILHNYGDGIHFSFVGPDEKSIDSAFYRDTMLKNSIASFYGEALTARAFYSSHGSEKYILELAAFKHFAKFISEHCNEIDKNESRINTFTIHSYAEDGDQICTYYYDAKLIKYFKEMIQYMEESPYKNEYKRLIEQLQLYIKNYSPNTE